MSQRMSLSALKKQASKQQQQQQQQQQQPTQPPPTPTLQKQPGPPQMSISSMQVNKSKVSEDGRTIKQPITPSKPHTTNDGFNLSTPNNKQPSMTPLQPLPLFTYPSTLPLRFDKYLKIEKNTTIGGQIFSYPIIGLNQYDASKLGLIIGDLVTFSLIQPDQTILDSPSTTTSSILSPVKTPSKNESSPFRHQHPSLSSPNQINSINTPNKQSPHSQHIPLGTHHHLFICKIHTFGSVERGQFRLDPLLRGLLPSFDIFQCHIASKIFPNSNNINTRAPPTDFLSNLTIQQTLETPSKREELDRSFFSDNFCYVTTLRHSSQYINNVQPTSNPLQLYPTTKVISLSSISLAKNNINLDKDQEMLLQTTAKTSSMQHPSTNNHQPSILSSSPNPSQSAQSSLPQQLSSSLDAALSSALTPLESSNSIFILPNAPLFACLCGSYQIFYPHSISSSHSPPPDASSSTNIIIYTTTPTTKVSITLGKQPTPSITESSTSSNNPKEHDQSGQLNQQSSRLESITTSTEPDSIAIAGLDQEMKILLETLELPLKQPDLFTKFSLKAPKGVLLFGPPGCGKTLLAKWFSLHTSAHFISLTATNILSRGGANYLYTLFNSFSKPTQNQHQQSIGSKSPIILFIDEIDGLCGDNTVVCALLSLLDGGHDLYSNICILGATNRPNVLPPALRRPGRFDVELNITPPSIQAREAILKTKLTRNHILHNLSQTDILSIAEHTNGFVGADIDLLLGEAISHSVLTAYQSQFQQEQETNHNIINHSEQSRNPSLSLDDFRHALRLVRPSGLRDYNAISVSDSQVGGHDEIKQRLEEAFEWPLRHSNLVEALGARKSSGILLFGPPGCAKTLLAKSICARSKRTFLSVKGPELFSKYVGDSEKAVRAIFQRARACAPCILFLDEVDSFGAARGGSGGDATDRVVSQLLVEMDGISDRGDVCILAATNRPDLVDKALLRAGRLDRSLYVGPPNHQETFEILSINLQKMACDPIIFTQLNEISQICYEKRHTGAELAAICRDASVRALTRYILEQEVKLKQMELDVSSLTAETFSQMCEQADEFPFQDETSSTLLANSQQTTQEDQSVIVTYQDLIGAIYAAQSRISPNMIQFYIDYQQKHGLSNL